MQTIITFTDACLKVGKDPMLTYHPYEKLEIIVAAIVGDWKADYSNEEQRKYYPWFEYDASSSAFVFHFSAYDFTSADAGGGVRLSLETREQANYVGETFIEEYNALLLRK